MVAPATPEGTKLPLYPPMKFGLEAGSSRSARLLLTFNSNALVSMVPRKLVPPMPLLPLSSQESCARARLGRTSRPNVRSANVPSRRRDPAPRAANERRRSFVFIMLLNRFVVVLPREFLREPFAAPAFIAYWSRKLEVGTRAGACHPFALLEAGTRALTSTRSWRRVA